MSSWRNRYHGRFGAVSIVALLVVGPLIGCGGGGSTSDSGGSTATPTQGSAATGTASGSSSAAQGTTSTAQRTHAPITQAKATPSGSTQGGSLPASGSLLRHFSGSGNTPLGTVVLSRPAVLVWTARHPPIQIFTAKGFILVSSHVSGGTVQVSPGIYAGLRVASHAGWSIELRERSR